MGCHQYTGWVPTQVYSSSTNTYTASVRKAEVFEKSWATMSTQNQHEQAHNISTKKYTTSVPKANVLKNHGPPSVHRISASKYKTSTQHRYQQTILFEKIMGYHQYTGSAPTSTQHEWQKRMFLKNHGLQSVQRIITNKYPASVPTGTQHQ